MNKTLSFLKGVLGFSILYLAVVLIVKFLGMEMGKLPLLFAVTGSAVIEELVKFLFIRYSGEEISGVAFGLGWGGWESFIKYMTAADRRLLLYSFPMLIHIVTSVILCHYIRKEEYALGLFTAICIHLGYNLIVLFAF